MTSALLFVTMAIFMALARCFFVAFCVWGGRWDLPAAAACAVWAALLCWAGIRCL